MTEYGPDVNVPPFHGEAREAFEVCFAADRMRPDRTNREMLALAKSPARVTVDGEWQRSEVKRDGLALVDLALHWKEQFREKGWTT
jgi:hypothetical protein